MGDRLRAVRGATTVEKNEKEAILDASAELLQALTEKNGLTVGDLAAVIFTVTPDLTAAFPAEAARVRLGWHAVPLLCVQEAAVQGALPFCVRVLLLAEFPAERQPAPVYLRQAISLRPDWAEKE
ncbi:MAG TPA: chorismate mutase [Firmicutes bacterium]|nr:chorismate mutase [Bacillota bacterium]